MSLEVQNLVRRFGKALALDGASLDARAGEVVALLGPSGCGKTTTLRCVAGLEEPNEGDILIGGKNVTGDPPWERDIAMMFQDYALFPHMTVEKQVGFGLEMRKWPALKRDKRVAEVLKAFEIDCFANRKPGSLSGGQRQMVAVGRALMLAPRLIMLDEPTAGLSPKFCTLIFERVRAIAAQGIAVLMVEQNARPALAIADRGMVLAMGRNRFEDAGPAVAANPEIGRMFLGG